jgi:hypothetical protein
MVVRGGDVLSDVLAARGLMEMLQMPVDPSRFQSVVELFRNIKLVKP